MYSCCPLCSFFVRTVAFFLVAMLLCASLVPMRVLGQVSSAPTLLRLSADREEYNANSFLEILEDRTGKLSFKEISAQENMQAFTRYTGTSDPNFGHTTSVYWVRLTLEFSQEVLTSAKAHHDWFLEIPYPQLDHIVFFTPNLSVSPEPPNITATQAYTAAYTAAYTVSYTARQSGDMLPFADGRDISYRMPCFRLPQPTSLTNTGIHTDSSSARRMDGAQTMTVYLRLESQGSMTFPIMFRTGEAMSRHIANEQFLLGIFYGILLVMIGYNLFVYISLRDASYLFYVAYILCYGMFLFIWNGLAFQYLWGNAPVWHNRSVIVFMGFSGLSIFVFSQNYLNTRHFAPRMHRFMNVMMAYFLVGMLLAFILPYSTAIRFMYGAPIFTLPIIVGVSVICLRKGYRPARYFLVAWVLLLTSISMAALRNLNLLPSGILTVYGLQIGSALEIFLLSLGLADRINVIKQEKKIAQDEALRSTELMIETLRQSEQELESKVRERTLELENANEEISRALDIQTEQSREIELANTALQEKNIIIEQERERSDELLLNILPRSIATRLMAGEKLIADRFESVSVLFADLAGFTVFASKTSPEELVGMLDTVFSEFDAIAQEHGLEKIKTIGDCYMAVAGLPLPQHDHATRTANTALAMQQVIANLSTMFDISLEMRVGLHSGSVVAGVIGKRKFAYDLWGDTVNIASRMESQGIAGKIHCSDIFAERLVQETKNAPTQDYICSPRGEIEIKGKGRMNTVWLERA